MSDQEVAEAARALVSPTTDPSTRSAASTFLEEWTRIPEAWNVYQRWIASFPQMMTSDASSEVVGIQLLCLTMLQGKIRRELPVGTPESQVLQQIRQELWSLLMSLSSQSSTKPASSVLGPLCTTTAALAVRCGHTAELFRTCRSGTTLPASIALRVLGSIPTEMDSCGDLTTPQVTAQLAPHLEEILDTVRKALQEQGSSSDTICPALEVLEEWIKIGHVSLSHLNSPTCGGTDPVLPILIQILSQQQPRDESTLILASRALEEAILVPSDIGSPYRESAVRQVLEGLRHGFIVAPFNYCVSTRWDDAAHALASMVSTLVTEEIDELCTQPAEAVLSLLLRIQDHPHTPVTLSVLECWLTVQEVPTKDRHENWKAPLFSKICESLVARIAYPPGFVKWEDEIELDEQEFSELRRMVGDVLVSSYFLLRVRYIQQLVGGIVSPNAPWNLVEAALTGLWNVSREVCQRVRAKGSSSLLTADRDATSQQLLQLVQYLCGNSAAIERNSKQHPLVIGAVAGFVGAYGPAWNVLCKGDGLLRMLAFLRLTMSVPGVTEKACIATRSILVSCSKPLLTEHSTERDVGQIMETTLSTGHPEGMTAVVEGLTRLTAQTPDLENARQGLCNLMAPILQRIDNGLGTMASSSTQAQRNAAVETVTKYLHVLQIVIRFSDAPTAGVSLLDTSINAISAILEKATVHASQEEVILDEVLALHSRLLSNARDLVLPRFSDTVKFVISVFEQTKHSGTLDYLAGALEAFDPITDDNLRSFTELLDHVSNITCVHLSQERRPNDATKLVCSFFELCQRYILFCPAGLVQGNNFGSTVSLSVECITACDGEKDSTRATIVFLSHVFGWKFLRLSVHAKQSLTALANVIDAQLGMHGERVTSACIAGLAGASPQMLWPALSECVFSIVLHVAGVNAGAPVVEESTVVHVWLYNALVQCQTKDGKRIPAETCQQIVKTLFELARHGTKSKSKAKMLLSDVGKICKGETGFDALLTYSL